MPLGGLATGELGGVTSVGFGSGTGGKNPFNIVTVTGLSYTAQPWDWVIVKTVGSTFGAPVVITSPASPAGGDEFMVSSEVTPSDINIIANSGQTIGLSSGTTPSTGSAFMTDTGQTPLGGSTVFKFDGTSNWIISESANTDTNAGLICYNHFEFADNTSGNALVQMAGPASTGFVNCTIPWVSSSAFAGAINNMAVGSSSPTFNSMGLLNPGTLNRTSTPTPNTNIRSGQLLYYVNETTGTITITPTTGTIDGQASIVLPPHSACFTMNNGVNMWTVGTFARASNTSLSAVATTPAPVTGTAFTPAANQDCELSFWVNTAATFTVTYGPSTGAENTIINAAAMPIGAFFNKTIPAGWKVVITGTIADLSNILAVTK